MWQDLWWNDRNGLLWQRLPAIRRLSFSTGNPRRCNSSWVAELLPSSVPRALIKTLDFCFHAVRTCDNACLLSKTDAHLWCIINGAQPPRLCCSSAFKRAFLIFLLGSANVYNLLTLFRPWTPPVISSSFVSSLFFFCHLSTKLTDWNLFLDN